MSIVATPSVDPRYSSVIKGTALVAEGGGQRGIFTAGVLDSWLDVNFNPFEILIGTSAGAQNLSSYVTKQAGFAHKSIMELSQDKHFFNLKRSFIGGHTVDLDWFFNQVKQSKYQLNVKAGVNAIHDRDLLFTTTNVTDYKAHFFRPNNDNWLTLLKASSALPFLYKKGVNIAGDYHVDGGLSAPLPVEEAYNRGAKKIVVIRTIPEGSQAMTPWLHRLRSWLRSRKQCVKAVNYYVHHENVYRRSLRFIENPPEDVEIIQIFPKVNLASKLIGSSDLELEHDYLAGKDVGRQLLSMGQLDFLVHQMPCTNVVNSTHWQAKSLQQAS